MPARPSACGREKKKKKKKSSISSRQLRTRGAVGVSALKIRREIIGPVWFTN
jgi:hypothetical protein